MLSQVPASLFVEVMPQAIISTTKGYNYETMAYLIDEVPEKLRCDPELYLYERIANFTRVQHDDGVRLFNEIRAAPTSG